MFDFKAFNPNRSFPVIILHWVVAVLFCVTTISGFRIADTGWSGQGILTRPTLYSLHQTIGIVIVILLMIWFAIRVPKIMDNKLSMGKRFVVVYHLGIAGLGGLIAILGIVGLLVNGGQFDLLMLSKFRLDIFAKDPHTVVSIFSLHKALISYFLGAVLFHFIGVLYHSARFS